MDIITAKMSLSIQAGLTRGLMSKEAKKKMDTVIAMAGFSIGNIAKAENLQSDVLLAVLANEIINKAAVSYLLSAENSEDNTERNDK